MCLGQAQTCFSIFGLDDCVALGFQCIADQLPHRFFILHQKNGFRPTTNRLESFHRSESFGRTFHLREIDPKGRPTTHFALSENVPATLFHDAVDGREPQSGAFAFFLGGEERFEDAGLDFLVHSQTRIGNG